MKKIIIIIIWLFPFSNHAEPELGVAFKGGPNTATLAENNRFHRYGFSGGLAAYLQRPVFDLISLAGQMELLYTPRGARAIFEGEVLGRSRQHYIDLTIAARPEVRFGPASGYLLLGGGLNLLVSARKENAFGASQDITGDLRRINMALLVGAGVALHLPRRGPDSFRLGTVFLEARHDRGLIDTDAVNGGFKTRTSSLMLGLSFALGAGEGTTRPKSPPVPSDPPSPLSPPAS